MQSIDECDEETENKELLIQNLNKFIAENYNNEIIIKSKEFWKSYLKNNHSIISTIFTGLFCSQIRCNNCNNCNISFEPFNILEVQLTDKNNNILQYLDECLTNFSTGETVNYKCDSCKNEGTATKQITIFDAPPRLIIQLKRFNANNSGTRHVGGKINNLINY